MPPETFLEIIIHLRAARMNRVSCIMGLTQNQLPEIIHIWHTDPVLVPQSTLIILSEMGSLALLEQLLTLLKYPFYPLFIHDNGMNSISKSLTVLTPAKLLVIFTFAHIFWRNFIFCRFLAYFRA